LTNVTFVDWLDREMLVTRVAQADVCLGAFGTTPQSLMTIQNKIYEGLAMGKPVVTGDGPAVRAALCHGEQVYLVRRADPDALAEAVLALRDDTALRERLAREGHRAYCRQYTPERLGARMLGHLEEVTIVRSA
jgi:glycosyltransferase involved in cell wall biosynthesis